MKEEKPYWTTKYPGCRIMATQELVQESGYRPSTLVLETIEDIMDELLESFEHQNYFKQVAYSSKRPNLIKRLEKDLLYPAWVSEVYNLMQILKAEFGPLQVSRRKVAIALFLLYRDKLVKEAHLNDWGNKPLRRKKAWKEQIARGFINRHDWDDYDPRYVYAASNIDRDYIYPVKLVHNWKSREDEPESLTAYHGAPLFGVPGHTRVQLPLEDW